MHTIQSLIQLLDSKGGEIRSEMSEEEWRRFCADLRACQTRVDAALNDSHTAYELLFDVLQRYQASLDHLPLSTLRFPAPAPTDPNASYSIKQRVFLEQVLRDFAKFEMHKPRRGKADNPGEKPT